MELKPLKLEGTFEIVPSVISDTRGYFAETYRAGVFEEAGLVTEWVQENQSLSTRLHTLRGLHYQAAPFAQTKLISVCMGRVLDVFVDIRTGSSTYGQWDSVELKADRCNGVYIPVGFAHGFCTLEENVIVQYKVDSPYSKESEGGIFWNDSDLNIDWPTDKPVLSERDRALVAFADFVSPF